MTGSEPISRRRGNYADQIHLLLLLIKRPYNAFLTAVHLHSL